MESTFAGVQAAMPATRKITGRQRKKYNQGVFMGFLMPFIILPKRHSVKYNTLM
jgi:hypothetical protein